MTPSNLPSIEGTIMDDAYIAPPDHDDVETHARDAVEAMRAAGTDRPDIERVLIGGAQRHAEFVRKRIGQVPEERT